MKVHPAANVLPMLSEGELKELAHNIKASGLLHPIIVDDKEQVVDGRNRLAACKMAKVKPRFEKLNGRDPRAYVISANLARRNLTKGQQAMVVAMLYPEREKGGRGKKSKAGNCPETGQFSKQRLSDARTVIKHSRELAESVLKGNRSLDQALKLITSPGPDDPSDERERRSRVLKVHFADYKDIKAFAELVNPKLSKIGNAPITRKTRSIYYPKPWWSEFWQGMPHFHQEDRDPIQTIKVYFPDKKDVEEFAGLVGQNIKDTTKFIWYPKAEISSVKYRRYVHDGTPSDDLKNRIYKLACTIPVPPEVLHNYIAQNGGPDGPTSAQADEILSELEALASSPDVVRDKINRVLAQPAEVAGRPQPQIGASRQQEVMARVAKLARDVMQGMISPAAMKKYILMKSGAGCLNDISTDQWETILSELEALASDPSALTAKISQVILAKPTSTDYHSEYDGPLEPSEYDDSPNETIPENYPEE